MWRSLHYLSLKSVPLDGGYRWRAFLVLVRKFLLLLLLGPVLLSCSRDGESVDDSTMAIASVTAVDPLSSLDILATSATATDIDLVNDLLPRDPYLRELSSGSIIGFETEQGADAWLGIPFAEAPVGELRWAAPRDPEPWTEARLAQAFASPCVQLAVDMEGSGIDPEANYGSEDCLYLNVYTPKGSSIETASRQLPVMFWIHGGGNSIGEASQFDGSLLANEQDVVVVTINYRLGPLGWFRHPEITGNGKTALDRSGNFGTLDQIKALTWTRDNISAFGGDPNNVTIFGESAGGPNR